VGGITPAQAGYGRGLTAGLEPGMGGDRRALWTCFCSFKTRRKSYTVGALTLHDLHQENLAAMQRVVELGRQMGRPIPTNLWSSRADLPGLSSAPGSRGSLVQHPSRPSSFVDMTTAFAEHPGSGRAPPSAAADSNCRDPRGGGTSRSVRRDSGWGVQPAVGGRGGGSGDGESRGPIISEFA
ncbi:unnamed protein product, partial [Sphacelaria rigidula]